MSNTDKPAPTAPVATPEEVRSFREQQAAEWSQYVAVQQITFNGALAFNLGDSVPASWVAKNKPDETLVAKIGSKSGNDLIKSLNASAASSPEQVDLGSPVSLNVSVPEGK
jgi:hypothetical protein